MTVAPVIFVPMGFGYYINLNRVVYFGRVNTNENRRVMAAAKTGGRFLDWTCGRKTQTIMLLDDDRVVGIGLAYGTVNNRILEACLNYNTPSYEKFSKLTPARTNRKVPIIPNYIKDDEDDAIEDVDDEIEEYDDEDEE